MKSRPPANPLLDKPPHDTSLPVKRERGDHDDDLLEDLPSAKRINSGSSSRLDGIRRISGRLSKKVFTTSLPSKSIEGVTHPNPSTAHVASSAAQTQLSSGHKADILVASSPHTSPPNPTPTAASTSSSKIAANESANYCTRPNPQLTTEDNVLRHVQQADWAIISHVETFSCYDMVLKFNILDLKTRTIEQERVSNGVHAEHCDAAKSLDEMVWLARDTIVQYVKRVPIGQGMNKGGGCKDVELKVKVLDLETRLVEWRKKFSVDNQL